VPTPEGSRSGEGKRTCRPISNQFQLCGWLICRRLLNRPTRKGPRPRLGLRRGGHGRCAHAGRRAICPRGDAHGPTTHSEFRDNSSLNALNDRFSDVLREKRRSPISNSAILGGGSRCPFLLGGQVPVIEGGQVPIIGASGPHHRGFMCHYRVVRCPL
jgi:hypothetical protein